MTNYIDSIFNILKCVKKCLKYENNTLPKLENYQLLKNSIIGTIKI